MDRRTDGWTDRQSGVESRSMRLNGAKPYYSAPAHPSATGIGRVSGLVFILFINKKIGAAFFLIRVVVVILAVLSGEGGEEEKSLD